MNNECLNNCCETNINGRVDRNVSDKTYRDYNILRNLPSVEGHVLKGDTSLTDMGIPYVFYDTCENWDAQSLLITIKDAIYVYTDYKLDEEGNVVPGIKIGDGLGYLIDAPFLSAPYDEHIANLDIHVTEQNKTFWNNKVRCYMDGENLIFTTN